MVEEEIKEWIDSYVSPSKYTNKKCGSNVLTKRIAEWADHGDKVAPAKVKLAMVEKGYEPELKIKNRCYYKICVANDSSNVDLLQRVLLPVQNQALASWVERNFPGAGVIKTTSRFSAHHFKGVEIKWHISRVRNMVIIDASWENGLHKCRLETRYTGRRV